MTLPPHVTLHLTPVDVWNGQRDRAEYLPEAFAAEGFIHCTDGEALVVEVGNRYYTKDPRTFCLLSIDVARVLARTIYEDAAQVYPHIYGPLNVDAVIDVRAVIRASDGAFLAIGDSQPALLPRQG
jgi:uncharacterized protein (DUF952 family)